MEFVELMLVEFVTPMLMNIKNLIDGYLTTFWWSCWL